MTTQRELFLPPLCARSGCFDRAVIELRLDSATLIPLCARCDSRRRSETLRDGDSVINVERRRLIFSPE